MKAIAAGYKVVAGPNDKGETVDDKGKPLLRAGIPADHFPPPFANEEAARAANGGALPPDLSLIVKAREGGAHYVYSIVTGFGDKPPAGWTVPDGKYYNPYFQGWNIAMPPPLTDGQVTFVDGAPAKIADEAHAVVTFLAWAAEPQYGRAQAHRLRRDDLPDRAVGPAVSVLPPGLERRALIGRVQVSGIRYQSPMLLSDARAPDT